MGFEQQRTEIADICKKLLNQNKVSLILGFTSGVPESSSIPFFIRKIEDIDNFRWDNTCTPNLAKYLIEKKEKLAIVAKPCDSRALAMYLAEKQIIRDNVYIIGVECAGMKNQDGSLAPGCERCNVKTPLVYDALVKGEFPVETQNPSAINENRRDGFEEKFLRFKKEMDKCVLCYSCRQACYGCYCETCFMDRNIPDWQPSDINTGRKMLFHLGRVMHLAGRCVECGACERACSSGVKIRYLINELTDFCKELYGYQSGMDPDEIPAMTAFDKNDREVGFLGGEDNGSCCYTKERNG
jgi:formate dehydrogenase subunit beta